MRAGNVALTTPGGNVFATPNGGLIRLLLEELGSWPYWHVVSGAIIKPRPLGVYTLFSWQLDRFETATTMDYAAVRRVVLQDPVLHPEAGPEQIEQRFAWDPIDEMLREVGGQVGFAPSFDEPTRTAIETFAENTWRGLSPAQRAVADTLRQVHGSLLAALALVIGRMSADLFAHAILATSPLHGVFGFPADSELSSEDVHAREYGFLRDQARTALAYLAATHPTEANIRLLIGQGESERLEMKETALGFPDGRPRERRLVKEKIARTAAAMMSRDGGRILIGVRKSGELVGLPELKEMSADQIQLALADFLLSRLGVDAASRVLMYLWPSAGAVVLVLVCPSVGQEVWVREGTDTRGLYMRQGPRTIQVAQKAESP